jgi:hypothetical protein
LAKKEEADQIKIETDSKVHKIIVVVGVGVDKRKKGLSPTMAYSKAAENAFVVPNPTR